MGGEGENGRIIGIAEDSTNEIGEADDPERVALGIADR